jgi:two-component system sensor histidine kinase MprB
VSLRTRLALIVAVTFAAVVIASVFAARVSASNQLRAETDRFLQERVQDRDLRGGPPPNGFAPPGADAGDSPFSEPDAIVQVTYNDGRTQLTPGQPSLPTLGPGFHNITVKGEPYRMLTATTPDGDTIRIARSVASNDHVLSTLDFRLLLIAIAGTIVAALAAWLIARRIVRPVEQLTGAAEHVAQTQDLSAQIDVARGDELGRLAESFNTMLGALQMSRAQQQRLVMDASHELRTPLTALRTNMEVLQRAANATDEERAQLLGEAQQELTELTDLVAELVDLATDVRAEEPVQRVELAEVAEEVAHRYERRTGRTINFEAHDPAAVNARVGALDRAISNLVDNACKFSTNGDAVDVRVDGTTVEVGDRGPGVAPDDRAHVFDRFYRAPSSRALPGSGLGLSIVKQIAVLHGGSVELDARPGGGTVARLQLPAS